MAHIFLSNLKSTLDNCITELEEIHFMFCKNPESDFSAFTQQRYKLQPEGWNFLFHIFVDQCRTLSDNLYNGYRLLACDD